jgi:uncharacterized protein YndB with AHSA1/START domain
VTSKTVTAVYPAPKERVFSYLADIDNLPRWATEFARELKVVDGRHKVVNGLGEFLFRIEADPETGVIDMLVGPTDDALALFPTRVVALGPDVSAFTFTMFRGPGTSEELFESQYRSLLREFENLEREFSG